MRGEATEPPLFLHGAEQRKSKSETSRLRCNAGIGERLAHALLAGPCGGGPGSVLLLGKPPLLAAASARATSRASGEVGREKGFFFACPVKGLPSHLLEFLSRPREVKVPPSTSSSIAGGDCPRRRRCRSGPCRVLRAGPRVGRDYSLGAAPGGTRGPPSLRRGGLEIEKALRPSVEHYHYHR